MSIQPQASFSSETTAVASRGNVYPSVEEFTSFKLPPKPTIIEPTYDDVSDLSVSDESHHTRRLAPRPFTPTPPSPVTTESTDRNLDDDTPSTVHGESMITPRNTLATAKRAPLLAVPASPRWPFQNATPRASVMVPITRSITESSQGFDRSARSSQVGQVSVSESLDEFQVNHPNARLLSLHPRPLTYISVARNLANIPELVEKPQGEAQSRQSVPATFGDGAASPFDYQHGRRWSRHLIDIHLHRRRRGDPDRATMVNETETFWLQRISLDSNVFRGSAILTLFFLINAFISTSSIVTLATTRLDVPHGLIVWAIVSLSTSVFTVTILCLMHKFRCAVVPFDEESQAGSAHQHKRSFDDHVQLPLPASPSEVYHRRQLAAATAAAEREPAAHEAHEAQATNESTKSVRGSEVIQTSRPSSAGPAIDTATPSSTRETDSVHLETGKTQGQDSNSAAVYCWTDVSLGPETSSDTSSMTAVIATASASEAPTNNPASGS
ncbi:hypothetical protein CTA2_8420 [Colletotrichum tanaceti]|uniref:Uncharacterized protein n=1 Tax=Colletotrichum tanaceti TaxID=1306861 RepID=A0A4U6X935_9PEZI|nr:hypothetical protein CTA2_8420 [Colletotrichum tanaceti]TKW51519.1 hypothetical protein CTA1_1310 [Colletotrichum tanaceti]